MRQLVGPILLCAAIAACAPVSDIGGRVLVVQGKYDPSTCEAMLNSLAAYKLNELQLVETINKSAQEASGHVVNAAVHWPALVDVRGNIRELEQSRAQKKCETPK